MSIRGLLGALAARQPAALFLLAAIGFGAWAVLLAPQATLPGTDALMAAMMRPTATGPYLAAAAFMWIVMMVAMMTPAVIPVATVYHRIQRTSRPNLATLSLATGYLSAWIFFAFTGAAGQWLLHTADVLHGARLGAGAWVAAGLLVAAGVYQLTPLKAACLKHCRSPMGFFMTHWRPGYGGAWVMGLHQGIFCVGCCWVLMLLMFAGGTMSLATMALLSTMILAERLLPAGPWVSKLPAGLLILLGCALAVSA